MPTGLRKPQPDPLTCRRYHFLARPRPWGTLYSTALQAANRIPILDRGRNLLPSGFIPASCVSNSHKSVTNRSLPACKRLEARAELEPLGAKTPYQIPAQGMVCPVPLFDMATWVQRHRARGVPPSCYTERAPAAVHHKTCPLADSEELSGFLGPLSVTRTGRCPVLDPYSR